jgi:hypothetical protein
VHALALEHLRIERALRYYGIPTVSYTQLGIFSTLPIVVLAAAVTRRRIRPKRPAPVGSVVHDSATQPV